jgi:hypothetical protein
MMDTLKIDFKNKLMEISKLSDKINKHDKNRLLDLIKEHIKEIEELYKKSNEHWTIETADLIILCYELLILENKNIDEVFNKCLPRYDIKLKRLAENVN